MTSRRELIVALELSKTKFDTDLANIKAELSKLERGVFVPININPASLKRITEQLAGLRRKFASLEASASIQAQLKTTDFIRQISGLQGLIKTVNQEKVQIGVEARDLDLFIDKLIDLSDELNKLPENIKLQLSLNDKEAYKQIEKLQTELIRFNHTHPIIKFNIEPAFKQVTFLQKELAILKDDIQLYANADNVLAEINRIRNAIENLPPIVLGAETVNSQIDVIRTNLASLANLLNETYTLNLNTTQVDNLRTLIVAINEHLTAPKEIELNVQKAFSKLAHLQKLINTLPSATLKLDPKSKIESQISLIKEKLKECVDLCVHTDKAEKAVNEVREKIKQLETVKIDFTADLLDLQAGVNAASNLLKAVPRSKSVTFTIKPGKNSLTAEQLDSLVANASTLAGRIDNLRQNVEPVLAAFKELQNIKLPSSLTSLEGINSKGIEGLVSTLKSIPTIIASASLNLDNLRNNLVKLANTSPLKLHLEINTGVLTTFKNEVETTSVNLQVNTKLITTLADASLSQWLGEPTQDKKITLTLNGIEEARTEIQNIANSINGLDSHLQKLKECIDICVHTNEALEKISKVNAALNQIKTHDVILRADLLDLSNGLNAASNLLKSFPSTKSVTLNVALGKRSLSVDSINELASTFRNIGQSLSTLKTDAQEAVVNLTAFSQLKVNDKNIQFDKKNWDEVLNFVTSLKALPAYLDSSILRLNTMGDNITRFTQGIKSLKQTINDQLTLKEGETNPSITLEAKLNTDQVIADIKALQGQERTIPLKADLDTVEATNTLSTWLQNGDKTKKVNLEIANQQQITDTLNSSQAAADALLATLKQLKECVDICLHTDKATAELDTLKTKIKEVFNVIPVTLDIQANEVKAKLQEIQTLLGRIPATKSITFTVAQGKNSLSTQDLQAFSHSIKELGVNLGQITQGFESFQNLNQLNTLQIPLDINELNAATVALDSIRTATNSAIRDLNNLKTEINSTLTELRKLDNKDVTIPVSLTLEKTNFNTVLNQVTEDPSYKKVILQLDFESIKQELQAWLNKEEKCKEVCLKLKENATQSLQNKVKEISLTTDIYVNLIVDEAEIARFKQSVQASFNGTTLTLGIALNDGTLANLKQTIEKSVKNLEVTLDKKNLDNLTVPVTLDYENSLQALRNSLQKALPASVNLEIQNKATFDNEVASTITPKDLKVSLIVDKKQLDDFINNAEVTKQVKFTGRVEQAVQAEENAEVLDTFVDALRKTFSDFDSSFHTGLSNSLSSFTQDLNTILQSALTRLDSILDQLRNLNYVQPSRAVPNEEVSKNIGEEISDVLEENRPIKQRDDINLESLEKDFKAAAKYFKSFVEKGRAKEDTVGKYVESLQKGIGQLGSSAGNEELLQNFRDLLRQYRPDSLNSLEDRRSSLDLDPKLVESFKADLNSNDSRTLAEKSKSLINKMSVLIQQVKGLDKAEKVSLNPYVIDPKSNGAVIGQKNVHLPVSTLKDFASGKITRNDLKVIVHELVHAAQNISEKQGSDIEYLNQPLNAAERKAIQKPIEAGYEGTVLRKEKDAYLFAERFVDEIQKSLGLEYIDKTGEDEQRKRLSDAKDTLHQLTTPDSLFNQKYAGRIEPEKLDSYIAATNAKISAIEASLQEASQTEKPSKNKSFENTVITRLNTIIGILRGQFKGSLESLNSLENNPRKKRQTALDEQLNQLGVSPSQLDPAIYRSLENIVDKALARNQNPSQINDLIRTALSGNPDNDDVVNVVQAEAENLRQNDDANTNRIVADNDGGDGMLPPGGGNGGNGGNGGDDNNDIPFDPDDDGRPRDIDEINNYISRQRELFQYGQDGRSRRRRFDEETGREERAARTPRRRRDNPLNNALLDIAVDSIEAYNNTLGNGLRIAVRINELLSDPEIADALLANIGSIATLAGFLASAFGLGAMVFIGREANIEFQKLDKTLRTLNIRQSALIKQKIPALALSSGVDLGDLTKGFRKFSAATDDTNLAFESPRILEAVVNYATVVGSSQDEIARGTVALEQLASKGRVSLEEINGQLAEAISGSTNIAASSIGLNKAEFYKMIQAGDLLAEDLLPAMATKLEDIVQNSKGLDLTLPQEWSRLMQAFKLVSGSSTEGFFSGLRDNLAGLNEGFKKNSEVVQFAVNRLRDLLLVILSLTSIAGVIGGIKLLTAAIGALATAVGLPAIAIGGLIIGLTTLLGLYNTLKNEPDILGKFGKQSAKDWQVFNEQIKQNIEMLEELNGKRFNSVKTTPMYQDIIVEVKGKNALSRMFLARQILGQYGKQLRQQEEGNYFNKLGQYAEAHKSYFSPEKLAETAQAVTATEFVERSKETATNTEKIVKQVNTSLGKGAPDTAAQYKKDLAAINQVIIAERKRVENLSALNFITTEAQKEGRDLQTLLEKPLFAEALGEDIKSATTYEQLLTLIAQKTTEANARSNEARDKIFPGGDIVLDSIITNLEELIALAGEYGGQNEEINAEVRELEEKLAAVKLAQKDYNELVEESVDLNSKLASSLKELDNKKAVQAAKTELADAVSQQNLLKELIAAGVSDSEAIAKTQQDLQRKKIEEQIKNLRNNYVDTEKLASGLSDKTLNVIKLEYGVDASKLDTFQLDKLIGNQALPTSDTELLTRLKEQQFNLVEVVRLENELLGLDIERNAELKERKDGLSDAEEKKQEAKEEFDEDVANSYKQLQEAGERLTEAYSDFTETLQDELQDINNDIKKQLRENSQSRNKLNTSRQNLLNGNTEDDAVEGLTSLAEKLEEIEDQRFDIESENIAIEREFDDGIEQLQNIFQDYLDAFADIADDLANAKEDYLDKLADIDKEIAEAEEKNKVANSLGADTSAYNKEFKTLVNEVEQSKDTSRPITKLPQTFIQQGLKESQEAEDTSSRETPDARAVRVAETVKERIKPSLDNIPLTIPAVPVAAITGDGSLLSVVVEIRDILKGQKTGEETVAKSDLLPKLDALATTAETKSESEYYKFLSRIVKQQHQSGGKEGMWLQPETFDQVDKLVNDSPAAFEGRHKPLNLIQGSRPHLEARRVQGLNNVGELEALVTQRRDKKKELNQLKIDDLGTQISQEIVNEISDGLNNLNDELSPSFQELFESYNRPSSPKDRFVGEATNDTREKIDTILADKEEITRQMESIDSQLKLIDKQMKNSNLSDSDRGIYAIYKDALLNQKANFSQLDPTAKLREEEARLQRQNADANRLFEYNLNASKTIDPQIQSQEQILAESQLSQDSRDKANFEIERLTQLKNYEAAIQEETLRLEELGYAFDEARIKAEENINTINALKLDQLKDEFNSVGKFAKDTFKETTRELFNLELFNAEESIGDQLIGLLQNVLNRIRDWAADKFTDWLNEKLFPDTQKPLLEQASLITSYTPSTQTQLPPLSNYPSVQSMDQTASQLSAAFLSANQKVASSAVSAETQAIETILSNRGQLNSRLDGGSQPSAGFTPGMNPQGDSSGMGMGGFGANGKMLSYLAGGTMVLQGILQKENRGRNIGAGLGMIAGTAFGGVAGGMIGSTLGGLIGGLFAEGGTVDSEKKPENLLKAIATERRKSGKKPVLAVLHENEEVLSTLNGDAQAYRQLQEAGMWNTIKNYTMYGGGTVGRTMNQSSLSFANNRDLSNRSVTNINNTINLQANSNDAVAYSLAQLSERKNRMPN